MKSCVVWLGTRVLCFRVGSTAACEERLFWCLQLFCLEQSYKDNLKNVFKTYINQSGSAFVLDKTTRITPWKHEHISEFRPPCTKPDRPRETEPRPCRDLSSRTSCWLKTRVQKVADTLELLSFSFKSVRNQIICNFKGDA